MSIHSQNDQVILEFGLKKPAFRIIVNSPATLGSIGLTTGLDPAMTLGCGGYGGNITSDNISPRHLLNIKRLAYEIAPAAARLEKSPTAVGDRRPGGIPAEALTSRIDQFLGARGYRAEPSEPPASPLGVPWARLRLRWTPPRPSTSSAKRTFGRPFKPAGSWSSPSEPSSRRRRGSLERPTACLSRLPGGGRGLPGALSGVRRRNAGLDCSFLLNLLDLVDQLSDWMIGFESRSEGRDPLPQAGAAALRATRPGDAAPADKTGVPARHVTTRSPR